MRYRVALFGLLLSLPALAMADEPSETDLKAAYCIEAVRIELSALRSGIGRGQKLDRQISEAEDRLNRLQGYLSPRVKNLDASGLATESKRAEVDAAQEIEQFTNPDPAHRCRIDDTTVACYEKLKSGVDPDVESRRRGCIKLEWLP